MNPRLLETFQKALRIAKFIEQHAVFLDTLSEQADISTGSSHSFSIDQPTHEDVVKCIQYFGGQWAKEVHVGVLSYTRHDLYRNLQLNLWNAGAPPNCKVVKKLVRVPAKAAYSYETEELVCPVAPMENVM